MPADVVRFVDSIGAAPTVRLNLNDETSWWVKSFSAPPPRIRRSSAANSMRDGINVGSATYDSRTLVIELECRKTTQDLAATEIQKLWRELDRTTNWLQYQPNGLTKPVFFRTYRSDTSGLADVMAQAAMRTITIDVLAEPFALGLRETLSTATVTNDPAAASNGCFLDVTGVMGDVPTPAIIGTTTHTVGVGFVAMRSRGIPSDLAWWVQCEAASGITLGTNTANPGGGPDAGMSGTGANNYRRTTFANANMDTRITWDLSVTSSTRAQRTALVGTYNVFACVRRTDSTSVIKMQRSGGSAVTVPATTVRQLVNLGPYSVESPATAVGYSQENPIRPGAIALGAQRVSGSGNIDWDYLAIVPADTSMLAWTVSAEPALETFVVDGYAATVSNYSLLGPFDPTGEVRGDAVAVGGFPTLVPNQVNRVYHLEAKPTGEHDKTRTNGLAVHYWPRYLFVRPVST